MRKWPQNDLCQFVEFVDIYPVFMTEKNLCIIPARGGSKRIPRKNIKPFLGKPIIAYSIDAAKSSGLFEEVMVSTDDEEIVEVAKEYGASVPFKRSSEKANDYATLPDVIEEVIQSYKKQGKHFNYSCCILPTAPLINIRNLVDGLKLLKEEKFYTIRPIVPFRYPIQRAFRYNNGEVEMFNPENQRVRSQDLEPAYHDAGQFYWFVFENGMIQKNKGALILSNKEVQDIDDEDDWELAEMKFKLLFQ